MSYDEYRGALLLGIDEITIVCHGRSNAKEIKNAIFIAKRFRGVKINNL